MLGFNIENLKYKINELISIIKHIFQLQMHKSDDTPYRNNC